MYQKSFIFFLINIICIHGRHTDAEEKHKYLPASEVTEGRCKCLYAAPRLNYTALEESKTYYVPMASAHAYRLYAEVLLGRPAKSYHELKEMCLVNTLNGEIVISGGYERFYSQKCVFVKDKYGVYSCKPLYGSAGTDISAYSSETGTYIISHVDHDGDGYDLLIRCINGRYADWEVISNTPKLSDYIAARITKKITELGFSEDNVMRLSCKTHDNYDKKSADATLNKTVEQQGEEPAPLLDTVAAPPPAEVLEAIP